MPCYPVCIETAVGETEEADFYREQLGRDIVKHYSQHKQFLCKGVITDNDGILLIRICETEKTSSEVVKRISAEKVKGAAFWAI